MNVRPLLAILLSFIEEAWKRPLGLPVGSVRAILALAAVGVVLLEIRGTEGGVPGELIALLVLVLGGYGFVRREQAQQEEHRRDMADLDSVKNAALDQARISYDASVARQGPGRVDAEEGQTGKS